MDSIQLSKIVANPTEVTWAQAYSTLNLYVVLSIKNESEVPPIADDLEDNKEKKSREAGSRFAGDDRSIAASGKDLLEKIQREYFSLDTKSLENIKKSIEAATSEAGDLKNISIVLANITNDILYLIVVSSARVIIKRNGKLATIAAGTPGEIEAYSGKILPSDLIILETEGFSEKIPVDKLSTTLDTSQVTEIAENLAPLIHADPTGTEAAIILQYKKDGTSPEMAAIAEDEVSNSKLAEESVRETPSSNPEGLEEKASLRPKQSDDLEWEKDAARDNTDEANDPISHLADNENVKSTPKFSLPKIFPGDKKMIVVGIIVLLALLLAGSIFFEKNRKEQATQTQILQDILDPSQKKFDEAIALVTLNKGLALDEFNDIKTSLTQAQGKLPEGSAARAKLDEFLAKVNQKINELSAGATLNNQKVIDQNSAQVVFRDDQLISTDSNGKISLLDPDGESTKDIDSKNKGAKAVGANENSVFVFGDSGITDSAKSGSSKTVVKDPGSVASLDTFGSNLYALNTTDKTVDKYPTGNFAKSAYFTEDITLNNPTSMTIDASIWILDDGKVRKFTKGKEDSFSVSGLTKNLGSSGVITTGIDYEDIYILDPANKRIVAISKSGEVKNQYVSKDLAKATSIAVNEPNKKVYVVISGKLNSFDL